MSQPKVQQQPPQPPQHKQQQPKLPEGQEYQPAQQKYKLYRKKKQYTPWLFSAILGLFPSFALFTSWLSTLIRFFTGWSVQKPLGRRPEKLLKLYEYEGDPNSRLVREALSILDLDAMVLPCPKGSKHFRAEAVKMGGKEKFPLLVDENADRKLYGARTIVPYLFRTYGDGEMPYRLRSPLVGLFSFLASLVRGFAGVRRTKGAKDIQIDPTSIELWNFEASPHCRLVREVLSELEIPYTLHNVAKRSPKRKEFIKRSGRMMVPYLVDKNTDKGSQGLFESCDIIKYLYKTYLYSRV